MVTAEEAKNIRSGIDIEGTVERQGDVRTVNTKAGGTVDVCDAYRKDSAGGEIKLALWAEDTKQFNDGDKIKITNGYSSEFRGEVSLTKGKFGKLEKVSDDA